MKALTTGSLYSRIYFAALLLVCFSMPFSVRFNSIALIISGVATIAWYIFEGRQSLVINRRILILPCYYLLCCIAFFTSQDTRSVLFDLEQKVPIIALPLIFMIGPSMDDDNRRLFQLVFVAAVLIVCMRIMPTAFEIGFRNDLLFENFPVIRRPYLGMYCVIASFFCIDVLLGSRSIWQKGIYIAGAAFFALFPAILLAKMAVVAWVILATILLSWWLVLNRSYKTIGSLLAVVIIFSFYFFFVNEKGHDIKDRLLTMSAFDWDNYDEQLVNSVNLRFIKWKCSAEVLSDDVTWLTGAGTGDAQQLLNQCYSKAVSEDSFLVVENYNSHNQFLTTWLNLGFIGFLFLVCHFAYALILYKREIQWIYFIFTAGIILFCLTESIFEVQKGIVLYSFFQALFMKIFKTNFIHDR